VPATAVEGALDRIEADAGDRLGCIVDDLITHSAQVGFLAPEDEGSRLEALEQYDVENFLACTGADGDTLTRDRNNEVLQNLGIVSYAGPNVEHDGQTTGQVCLIGHERRSYDEAQRRQLQRFADTDTRSVSRFLNSTFLTSLRRNDAIGVCAVDTSADIESDLELSVSALDASGDALCVGVSGRGPTASSRRRRPHPPAPTRRGYPSPLSSVMTTSPSSMATFISVLAS